MKYKKNVYQSMVMITQFGINMIVPIFMCTLVGVWIGEKWNIPIIIIPLFIIGALAGFRNVYIMAKKIFNQKSERDTKHVKKTQ